MSEPLRLLILGAHPDDAEFHAGGLAIIYRQLGHTVKMVSLTNGDAGHHLVRGPELAARRRQEAAAAGAVIGAEYVTWDHHDGLLQPTLELRFEVIRELRRFRLARSAGDTLSIVVGVRWLPAEPRVCPPR